MMARKTTARQVMEKRMLRKSSDLPQESEDLSRHRPRGQSALVSGMQKANTEAKRVADLERENTQLKKKIAEILKTSS